VALLPETGSAEGAAFAERVRDLFGHGMSAGVASYPEGGAPIRTARDLFNAANSALEKAKNEKNCVRIMGA
jgi:hypothetical protein